jgi:hypothetical protein
MRKAGVPEDYGRPLAVSYFRQPLPTIALLPTDVMGLGCAKTRGLDVYFTRLGLSCLRGRSTSKYFKMNWPSRPLSGPPQ